VLLAHAIRFNADTVDLTGIAAALGDPDDAAGAVDRLRAAIGLPATLSECGVSEDDLDAVARLSQRNRNVLANPKPVSEDDARSILDAAY
jgi:alcohol dehydrogenase class IV